jgi:hypothetical protein
MYAHIDVSPASEIRFSGAEINTYTINPKHMETHMSENIADILQKVRKLLALAEGSTNENECASARAAADRLITSHRLTMADIEAKGGETEAFDSKTINRSGRRLQWQEVILNSLCLTYGGAFFYSSYRVGGCGGRGGGVGSCGKAAYTVVAKPSDIVVIEYFFSYLCAEVDRLARWHTGGQGIAASNGFRSGCSAGIAAQFSDMRAAMRAAAEVSHSTALVVLDKRSELANAHMNALPGMHKGTGLRGGSDASARALGYAEGKKVSLKKGLEGGTNTPKLA